MKIKKLYKQMKKYITLTISILAIVLSSVAIISVFVFATDKPDEESYYKEIVKENLQNFSAPLPQHLTLCSEEVPMDNIFVREALDRELTSLMYQHASTFIIMKRAFRYFPLIEKYLKDNSAPEDLKYLAVAESSLNNVTSPAKAEGFWQFMAATAKQYGLIVTEEYDERYNLEKATSAAAKYLKASKNRLGSWSLACAAYNCGEQGVKNRMNEQGISSYWDLALNTETARYVYRILAYKILMSDPQQYGFYLRQKDAYQSLEFENIRVDTTINDFYAFSKSIGTTYKLFRFANPELRSKKLTNKNKHTYLLRKVKSSLSWEELVGELEQPSSFIESL